METVERVTIFLSMQHNNFIGEHLQSDLNFPMWVELAKIPFLCKIVPRQRKAAKAVQIIRDTVEKLVTQCKEIVEAEKETLQGEEYVNESDPSVLRFLLASREEVPSHLFPVVFFYRSVFGYFD